MRRIIGNVLSCGGLLIGAGLIIYKSFVVSHVFGIFMIAVLAIIAGIWIEDE